MDVTRRDDEDLADLIAAVQGEPHSPPVEVLSGDGLDDGLVPSVDREEGGLPPRDDPIYLDDDTAELAVLIGNRKNYVVDHNEIPDGLVEYIRTITKSRWVADQVLDRAAPTVLRRIRLDIPVTRRARWAKRWRPEEQERTKLWLGKLRDDVVRAAHLGRTMAHVSYDAIPKSLEAWRPHETGVLVIDDNQNPHLSFGTPGYLEQTPPKLIRWIHETWLLQHLEGLGDDVGLDDVMKPRVWDITAGSGTGSDYFGRLRGCKVIASDLTIAAADVAQEDCRRLGLMHQHRGVPRGALCRPSTVVTSPDIVLFDPPARGTPLHSQVYGDGPRVEDLAALDREPWLFTVADVAVRAASRLAVGGLVSLLVRCGVRNHGEVEPDDSLLEDLKTVLDGRVTIVHEMPLRYRSVRNQASLGQSRSPAVHVTLARAA